MAALSVLVVGFVEKKNQEVDYPEMADGY